MITSIHALIYSDDANATQAGPLAPRPGGEQDGRDIKSN